MMDADDKMIVLIFGAMMAPILLLVIGYVAVEIIKALGC